MAIRQPSKKPSGSTTRLGKSEAREKFLPLVRSVAQGGSPIEITEHGESIAVLVNYHQYELMRSRYAAEQQLQQSPVGTIEILCGDLEAASREISDQLLKSINKSAKSL